MSIYKSGNAVSLVAKIQAARADRARRKAIARQYAKGCPQRRLIVAKVRKMDTIIKRPNVNGQTRQRVGGGVRKPITELSARSLRAMKLHFRSLPDAKNIVTLTYPADYPLDGKAVKYHLRVMRQWFKYRGISAAWFLEFQARGAPHFHLITDGDVDKSALSQQWYNVVGSGDEKHLRAGTQQARIRKPHAIAAYVAKYASKADQKVVPKEYSNVGRFWGAWGRYQHVDQAVLSGVQDDGGAIAAPDQNAVALNCAIRSARKLLKSRGQYVRDTGLYGITLWGIGLGVMSQLVHWYGYVDQVPF